MMSPRRRTLWTIALAFLAGTAGVLLGCWIMMPRAPHGTELHALHSPAESVNHRSVAAVWPYVQQVVSRLS